LVGAAAACRRTPVIFNFGDSNSDTGGLQVGLGFIRGRPYGRLLPDGPIGRVSDGRLIIDFLCESVKASHLSPYLESLGADFTNGANFAVSGSATLPKTVPFSLFIQVLQFLRFRSRSLDLISQAKKGSEDLINEEGFRNALYTIDIGQNDLYLAFFANSSYSQVVDKIPLALAEIKGAVKARPLGCLPQAHTIYWNGSSPVDEFGCLKSFNTAAKEFNKGLSSLCDELRSELKDSSVVYTDMYAIKRGLIANYSKHNFEDPMKTCMACGCQACGDACQSCTCQTCSEGPLYISWDGVHYTEAANAILASEILSTKYSMPRVKFSKFCRV
ncbi:hypothetical protein Taro_013831, partial [Colocasia esculenta]|nr:hypothetical protein [Colocasia esculenta]